MSIVAYTGLPGSGKSYGVVENVVVPALKAGRLVCHNMPLNEGELLAYCKAGMLQQLAREMKAADIVEACPPGAVIVLDECWRYWPSGMNASTIPERQKEFFAMHRHRVGEDGFATEIVLVTQDLSQVASFVRNLVEQTFRANKLTAIGSAKRFRIDVFEGAVTGPHPPPAKRLREIFGKYKPEVYALYSSHTQSQSGGAGQEVKADQRGNVLKGWKLRIAVLALLSVPFLLWGAGCSVLKFRDQAGRGAKAERSEGQSAPAPVTPVSSVPAPPPKPRESSTWRFAGRITVEGQERVVLDSEHGARMIPVELCRRDAALNDVCELDGEVIASWTGPQPAALNQWFQASAQPAGSTP